MENEDWLLCPYCNKKTRIRLRHDTVLLNFPLYCPKCKQKALLNVQQQKMYVIKEPDVKTQSR